MRAWALAGALFAGLAWAQDPLATRRGWEVGGQISHYRYEEPGFMSLDGPRFGVSGAYTIVTPQRPFLRVEGRASLGRLDYEGSGSLPDVPDQIFEARVLAGGDFGNGRLRWSPYAGVAFRHLYNDLRGVSSTGAVGYQRESTYFYLPLGVTLRTPLGDGWVLAPQLEYDVFVRGEQRSYLSDTGLGLSDVTNRQDGGRGYRGQLMLERQRWTFGAWLQYWNIEDSDLQPIAPGVRVYEPANETREAGLELRYRF
ncbi:MAG TPA: outer membrane beta-barrel protein [Burkholderiales bacterium]